MSSLLKDKKENNTFAQSAQKPVFKENTSLSQSSQSPLSQKLAEISHDFAEEVRALPTHHEGAHTLNKHTDLSRHANHEEDRSKHVSTEENVYFTSPHVRDETLNKQGLDNRSSAKQLPFNLDKRGMQNTLAQHASTQVFLQNNLQRHEAKSVLANVPAYSKKSSIAVYKKQLVETRTLIYYQQHLRMLSDKEKKDPEARRRFVIKRVARELWTNFCVRGQETPMLQYLHDALRKEYNEDLKFYYKPGSIELIIMRPVDPAHQTENKGLNNNVKTLKKGTQKTTDKKITKEEALKLAMANQEMIKEELAKQKAESQEKNPFRKQNLSQHTEFDLQSYEAVDRQTQVEMVNKAWQLSQNIIASYATE